MSSSEAGLTTTAAGSPATVEVHRDVRVPIGPRGESLAADVHLPLADGPVPAVVTVWPYRKDIGMAELAFRWFAQRGYAAVLVDARGTGSSDGTQRPPFDEEEADDAVAVIDWVAEQPWCDGNVGMWGHSYGAMMSLRAAARSPESLRAILPYQCVIDPERELWHPDGVRGGITLLSWGAMTLSQQLLPPLRDPNNAEEHARWRRRLDAEPWILDLFRHGPGDSVWASRQIDAAAIQTPTLCVGGWRDLMCAGTLHAFEQIAGPKRLVVGPWNHTIPHDSPAAPIDFLSLALRWWDHWLRGVDTGIMDEPAVALYIQGDQPDWQGYTQWPPQGQSTTLSSVPSGGLTEPADDWAAPEEPLASVRGDATAGVLSGPWWLGNPGLTLDQHDDDQRGLAMTSLPLDAALLLAGRPHARVWLPTKSDSLESGVTPRRLVVRLSEVDPDGRSTFVTSGVVTAHPDAAEHDVTMFPTAYRIPKGHRLRAVISDADFPRLWPESSLTHLEIRGIQLDLPTIAEDSGAAVELPKLVPFVADGPPLAVRAEQCWSITREPIHDEVEVSVREDVSAYTPGLEALVELEQQVSGRVRSSVPASAVMLADNRTAARLRSGETFEVRVRVRMTGVGLTVTGDVSIDETPTFTRTWQI